MRQLTSLDAQFLALESSNQTGHVAGLTILDPSTKPSGELTFQDICALMEERLFGPDIARSVRGEPLATTRERVDGWLWDKLSYYL